MKYMKQHVKDQGDTPLCNVNRAEEYTVTLDEDQGEVPTGRRRTSHRERIRSSRAPKPRNTFEVVKACAGGVDQESQSNDKTMHASIEAGQKNASAQSAQSAWSDELMHRGDRSSSE